MCAWASDQSLAPEDLRRLNSAIHGDVTALADFCERLEIPILAEALRETRDLSLALMLVRPTLQSLCEEYLDGILPPAAWPGRVKSLIAERAKELAKSHDSDSQSSSPQSHMTVISRVVRMRAVRSALPDLPLPELLALLMHFYSRSGPGQMVGLVADTPEAASEALDQAISRIERALAEAERQP
jgi:hypothetical protein